ncbi:hypothetical protein HYH03_005562 [Edaphochlamys debaryana]|uniref:Uncharacterized protein n=1 Tax=Edaphochlamys debaryana TaxID=47281 RepID=A0A836C1Z3_9CHLO|nr:hypothetical protein HYH03_005562 [Edaphochlamys debaryana]|eukprot:KAG2496332.1 hypothetical protein HYH03_005562 [Edaphochlamys debaryana]
MAVARVAVLAVLAAALFLAVPSGVGAQDVTITEFKTLDKKENKASPPPRRQVSPPPLKKYDAYSYKKKYVYIASTEKYSYEDAYNFCYSNGYGMVPYNDKILMGPSSELCFNSEKGCWVGGKQGNYCAFVDPKGNGGAYANDCKERHYVICYGLLKGGK